MNDHPAKQPAAEGGDSLTITPLVNTDWEAVRAIYLEGIATGQATFETAAPDWPAWDAAHLADGRLVARHAGQVVGWAALSPVSSRCVYGGVAEVSVYVAEKARGQGVGRALLSALVEASEAAGIWTLQASMFPENEASARLHESCGFRVVGRRERIGRLHGVWRDTLLLERRSRRVGVGEG
jgi:L-amino acid N-acyltransferase YncA